MSVSSDTKDWFVCPQVNPGAWTRLFLFPYAGGGPSVFNKWVSKFPDNLEVWIAHYPGRGSRHHESFIKQVVDLAEELSQAIEPFFDKPFAFFGHSLGGLVAFEAARQLQQQKLHQPEILFVSACGAPHIPDPNPPIHKYADLEFIKSLRELNGIPLEVLHQPEVLQLLLPILRADFEASQSYHYHPGESPLHVPIVAFAGLDDLRVSQERVEGWSLHTDTGFESQYFPGDHFFINTCGEAVVASIASKLISSYEEN